MGADVERYFEQLRKEVEALGAGGGLAAASMYDTAQVLRFAPDPDPQRRVKVIHWLLQQQRVEGARGAKGWGKPGVPPLAQSVPTMAALLALHERQADCSEDLRKTVREAVISGVEFMRQNAQAWAAAIPLPDDIPVAVELILPMLLDDAPAEWDLPRDAFKTLRALGEKRRMLIAKFKPGPDSTPAHAFESWGGALKDWEVDAEDPRNEKRPEDRWLVSLGNRVTPGAGTVTGRRAVGHSPSATAFWLKRKLQKLKSLPGGESEFIRSNTFQEIQNYLVDATASTQTPVSGTYPTCYPIDRWEQIWGLLSLYETELLDDARLQAVVETQLEDVRKALALKTDGIGLSDHFVSDGDDTAAALAVVLASPPKDAGTLQSLRESAKALRGRFEQKDGQFTTYPHELQPSLTTTTHWMLVLELLGEKMSASAGLVRAAQEDEGSWTGLWLVDKWNCSWLYATSQSMIALALADDADADKALGQAVPRLIEKQWSDGSWGESRGTNTETAFGARSLLCILRKRPHLLAGEDKAKATRSLQLAAEWLTAHVADDAEKFGTAYWIDKEPFATPRLDRVYVLSSLIALKRAGY